MKVLSDGPGGDGLRSVVVGFGPESPKVGGFFGIELKVDPAVLTRPRPKLLNYAVMQPTVDALNFVQISSVNKSIEIFDKVQNSGGSSLIGDYKFLDAESPRGVPVRFVPRAGEDLAIELVSFNIEVPAFEATGKFYKRAMGLKEIEYPESEPPVQKFSKYLTSPSGGPNLLLVPVPDGRLKERALDEFEGLLVTAPSHAAVAKIATAAVELARKELEDAEKALELTRTKKVDSNGDPIPVKKKGTQAKPSVETSDKMTRIDDGVGNMLFVSDTAEWEKTLTV